MPLFSSNYISNWYKAQDIDSKDFYVLESIKSSMSVSQSKKDYIQGDGGTHAIAPLQTVWSTELSSPILLITQSDSFREDFKDILDIFLDSYDKLKYYYLNASEAEFANVNSEIFLRPKDILASATLDFTERGSSVMLTYNCKYDKKFSINRNDTLSESNNKDNSTGLYGVDRLYSDLDKYSFIARAVRNYDVSLFVHENGEKYAVKNMKLRFGFDYNAVNFINSNTSIPFFEPKGYSISGEVELIIPPDKLDTFFYPLQNDDTKLTAGQNFMQLVRDKINLSVILSDGRIIKVGLASLSSQVSISLRTESGVATVNMQFEAFASVI